MEAEPHLYFDYKKHKVSKTKEARVGEGMRCFNTIKRELLYGVEWYTMIKMEVERVTARLRAWMWRRFSWLRA
ncbi:hypothetical protein AAZX31_03G077400 [Glycine max]|nr:hypothetical protein GLYMA_03G085150v4 [Glycine max]KAH1069126.1 hypothetical protein GYH30_006636 [Glycine max]